MFERDWTTHQKRLREITQGVKEVINICAVYTSSNASKMSMLGWCQHLLAPETASLIIPSSKQAKRSPEQSKAEQGGMVKLAKCPQLRSMQMVYRNMTSMPILAIACYIRKTPYGTFLENGNEIKAVDHQYSGLKFSNTIAKP